MKSINKSSLSARRAWIEIATSLLVYLALIVALRKESVDRNAAWTGCLREMHQSLSARRAWIEMRTPHQRNTRPIRRSPQGERG